MQTMGTAFDGRWYLKIAQHGYPDRLYQEGQGSRWAFFPGFPAAVRAVSEVTRLSLARRSRPGRLRLRADLGTRHLAGRPGGLRHPAGRPRCPALRLLPDRVRPVPRLHRGALPDRSRRLPLRLVAALLDHGGTLCLRGRADPDDRYRRHPGCSRRGAPGCVARAGLEACRRGRDRPSGPCRLHGLRLGDGGHSGGVPLGGAVLAGPALRVVRHSCWRPLRHAARRGDVPDQCHGRVGTGPGLRRHLALGSPVAHLADRRRSHCRRARRAGGCTR